MKTLFLMRHAHARQEEAGGGDHDRPLDERGRREATQMARRIAAAGPTPELIVCSSARRTRETAELVAAAWTGVPAVVAEPRLYHAAVADLLQAVVGLPPDADRALLIGHNPGLQEFVAELTGAAEAFPTASVALLELDGAWAEFGAASRVSLSALWRPDDRDG